MLRLLGGVPNADTFAQPLPLLLVALKRMFLQRRGASDSQVNYPLADQIYDAAYPKQAFTQFLETEQLTRSTIAEVLEEMREYSGQYFKPEKPLRCLDDWQAGTLLKFSFKYFAEHGEPNLSGPIFWKETFAEEFLPYFLRHGTRTVLVLRDPRDVITSQVMGESALHAGPPRPLLYIARQWRKSAAYALAFRENPRFEVIPYERLVTNTDHVIGSMLRRFRVTSRSAVETPIDTSAVLEDWLGNSSFGAIRNISSDSIGRFRGRLSEDHRRFIEALCYSEMKALGYQPQIRSTEVREILEYGPTKDFRARPDLARYAYQHERIAEELNRHRSLTDVDGAFDQTIHIFEAAFDACRRVRER